VNKLQQQLTSGKQISAPSDSPTGTNQALQIRQDQSATAQQAANISDGQGWLDATDSALGSMIEQVQRVRALTVQGSNSATMSPAARAALAVEVSVLREGLLGLANSTVNGRPLFGGATVDGAAYDTTTGTYVGVGGANGIPVVENRRRVSDVADIRVDVTGPEAFGDPAARDLFAVVADVAAHVVADPTALSADLGALDVALDRLISAQATIGARSARMEAAAEVNADLQLNLAGRLAGVEDIDIAKTIMDLNQQQVGYQAALQATAQVIQPTLVDFLR
jgi:flagellar hook-associated protein 3 FlgL